MTSGTGLVPTTPPTAVGWHPTPEVKRRVEAITSQFTMEELRLWTLECERQGVPVCFAMPALAALVLVRREHPEVAG
jgi:hypothetical protein